MKLELGTLSGVIRDSAIEYLQKQSNILRRNIEIEKSHAHYTYHVPVKVKTEIVWMDMGEKKDVLNMGFD